MSAFFEPRLSLDSPSALASKWHLWRNKRNHSARVQGYLEEGKQITGLVDQYRALSESDFSAQQQRFESLARRGRLATQREDLHKALACIVVLSERHLGMAPYPIQLSCALAMIDGYLVQLAPGEGKTLTIGVVSVIFGWSQKPCHVITANDYLAERDREKLQPLYEATNVVASFVEQELDPEEKARRYQAHIVYATAKQLLADYLNDVIKLGGLASRTRMALTNWQAGGHSLQMRGLYYVIIDEADSILIDDATTPLIISAQEENGLLHEAVLIAKEFVDTLEADRDYKLQQDDWDIQFTPLGQQKITEGTQKFPMLWHHRGRLEDLISQAILARDRFKLDEHFVIVDEEVILVDESTGRMMHGRSWSYGLHQAVEARVDVPLTPPSKTLEKMSFQNFFQSYHHLTGASGTLQNVQQELFHTYRVHTLEMPTRLPLKLKVSDFQCHLSKEDKNQALIALIHRIQESGLPILLGTRRIRDTEQLEVILEQAGFEFNVLNAKRLAQEADIVATAGEMRKITLSTNMAGRGTDIPVEKEVLALGGLQVIMYEPHDSSRIDWQLFGRAGRQGNPGHAFPLLSLEDPLFQNLKWRQRPLFWLARQLLNHSIGRSLVKKLVTSAQRNAQAKAFKQRKYIAKTVRSSQERMSFIRNKTQLKS
ncbi:hypothetical protein J9B83_11390 [Marinomonas sp. A79]|uniref:Protein translocase subunit SecA n=1 Tax=Marinomonas vulgaris TaxID=2823372 RepID=A0ABS5HDI4_9GAMM|nr:helicase-related protein [Marinomonas vulgaris]MBR7889545.1 hypothetical protein [Marinomonas vulgaris]